MTSTESAPRLVPRPALRVPRLPLTLFFACAVAAAELGCQALCKPHADRVAAWASTNVARLTSEPIGPLFASVFVIDDHRPLWLALVALGAAIVEARFGWRGTALVAFAGHIGGTAVSESIVWWRVGHGRLPDSALHQIDVGVSYVVVGLLSAAVLAGRPIAAKLVAGAALVAIGPGLLEGLTHLDVAPVGHLTAFLVAGIFAGVLFVKQHRRQRIQDPVPSRTQ